LTVALNPCNGSEERFNSLTISLDNDGDGLYDMNDPDCQSVPAGAMSMSPAGGLSSSGVQGGSFSPLSQSYTLTNTGGAAINWTASKTQPWVTLSPASGTLAAGATATVTASINSGASSLAAGSYSDTVTFTNTTNGTGNSTRPVSLTVNAVAAPTISTASPLTGGTVGDAYSLTLAASGGTAPYAWSVSAGALPAGLALNASTGVLGGMPTAAGTFTFTVQVTGGGSSTKAFSLTISATPDTTPPVLNSVDPADTRTGVAVNTVLTATFSEGIVVPEGSFTLSDGAGSVPGSVSIDGATATFTPSVILSDNTVYTVTLTTAVTDLAGNPLGTGYGSTFTTSAAAPASTLDLESSGGGGCAIVRSGGGIGEIAGAYGFLILAALGMAVRKRIRTKAE
jgi:hypothetical protein